MNDSTTIIGKQLQKRQTTTHSQKNVDNFLRTNIVSSKKVIIFAEL